MTAQEDHALQKMREHLAAQSNIRLGIVFGSLAKGRAGRDSDPDIALLASRPLDAKRCARLIEALAGISVRPLDIVDLLTAGVPIARSYVRKV